MTYSELFTELCRYKKPYLVHKYEVFNDIYHWPKILQTATDIGPIYRMDFSENIGQMYKYKPQSSHFRKAEY